jgi:hypothetical protein
MQFSLIFFELVYFVPGSIVDRAGHRLTALYRVSLRANKVSNSVKATRIVNPSQREVYKRGNCI